MGKNNNAIKLNSGSAISGTIHAFHPHTTQNDKNLTHTDDTTRDLGIRYQWARVVIAQKQVVSAYTHSTISSNRCSAQLMLVRYPPAVSSLGYRVLSYRVDSQTCLVSCRLRPASPSTIQLVRRGKAHEGQTEAAILSIRHDSNWSISLDSTRVNRSELTECISLSILIHTSIFISYASASVIRFINTF